MCCNNLSQRQMNRVIEDFSGLQLKAFQSETVIESYGEWKDIAFMYITWAQICKINQNRHLHTLRHLQIYLGNDWVFTMILFGTGIIGDFFLSSSPPPMAIITLIIKRKNLSLRIDGLQEGKPPSQSLVPLFGSIIRLYFSGKLTS